MPYDFWQTCFFIQFVFIDESSYFTNPDVCEHGHLKCRRKQNESLKNTNRHRVRSEFSSLIASSVVHIFKIVSTWPKGRVGRDRKRVSKYTRYIKSLLNYTWDHDKSFHAINYDNEASSHTTIFWVTPNVVSIRITRIGQP